MQGRAPVSPGCDSDEREALAQSCLRLRRRGPHPVRETANDPVAIPPRHITRRARAAHQSTAFLPCPHAQRSGSSPPSSPPLSAGVAPSGLLSQAPSRDFPDTRFGDRRLSRYLPCPSSGSSLPVWLANYPPVRSFALPALLPVGLRGILKSTVLTQRSVTIPNLTQPALVTRSLAVCPCLHARPSRRILRWCRRASRFAHGRHPGRFWRPSQPMVPTLILVSNTSSRATRSSISRGTVDANSFLTLGVPLEHREHARDVRSLRIRARAVHHLSVLPGNLPSATWTSCRSAAAAAFSKHTDRYIDTTVQCKHSCSSVQ